MVIIAERIAAARQVARTDFQDAKNTYRQAFEILKNGDPRWKFFGEANAMFWIFAYPFVAVPSTIIGTIGAFLRTPNRMA